MNVFDLEAVLTLDSSAYDSGLSDAEGKASSMGRKIASGFGTVAKAGAVAVTAAVAVGTAAVGAFAGAARQTAEYGDHIDKMSQKMGMSAQAYQEWDAVMQHSGTSMEAMKAGMKTLANAVEKGNDAFQRIGLTQQEIASMSQEDLFAATIAGLQGVENETERTYLAGQLLGRGATELGALLNTSAEDTQAMRDRVHELGGALSDEAVKNAARFQDSLQDMHTAIDGAKNSLVGGFLPAISDVMDGIGNVVSGFDVEGGLEQIQQGVDGFIANMGEVIPRVMELAGRIIPAFASAIATNLPQIAQAGMDVILMLGQGIADHIPDIIAKLPAIIVGIVNFITTNLPAILQVGMQIIFGIIQGLAQAIPQLLAYAPQILSMIGQGIMSSLQVLWDNGPQIVQAIGQGILNSINSLLDLGVYIVQSIAEGILSALGFLGDVIISLFEGGKSAGDTAAAGYRSLGEHAATEAQAGLEEGTISFSGAVQSFLAQGHQSGESETGAYTSVGVTAGENVTNGYVSTAGLFNTAVTGTMQNGVSTAEGLASLWTVPGASATENLASGIASGEGAVDGAVSGAMSSAQSAGEAAATMFGSVGTSMVNQTTSSIAAAAPAVSSAARGVITTAFTVANAATSMFNAVGANIARGIAAGISSGSGAIAAAARSAVQAAVAAAKAAAAISSPSKKFRDEVGVFMGLGIAEGLEDSEDEVTKAAKKLAEKTYATSKEWLRRQTKFNRLSLAEQLEVWQEIQSGYITESKQWIQAEEEIFDLREKIQSNFADDVEKLWKNITDAQDKYADALEKRIDDIAGAYKLFDDVQDREAVSGQELTENLTRQVNVLNDFYGGLDALAARGVSGDLVEEIRDMGPKAVDNLDALLAMTDEQLSEYADLYGQKQAFANQQALRELQGLKAETDAQIKENMQSILDLYDETAPTLGEAFTDGLAKGILDGVPDVVSAAVEASRAALEAASGTMFGKQRSFSRSGLGKASAGMINSVAQHTAQTGGTTTINLVTPDGGVLARYVFDPLKQYAAAKGQPIVNPA